MSTDPGVTRTLAEHYISPLVVPQPFEADASSPTLESPFGESAADRVPEAFDGIAESYAPASGSFAAQTPQGFEMQAEAQSEAESESSLRAWQEQFGAVAAAADTDLEPILEYQSQPSPPPVVTKSFSQQALAQLPDVLRAQPLVRLETTVPTDRILWMISAVRANRSSDTSWVDRLLVDIADLPLVAPTSTAHVTVFKTVPFDPAIERDRVRAFHAYSLTAHPSTDRPRPYVVGVVPYMAHRAYEDALQLPAGSISAGAGLASQMTVDEGAEYKLVVYLLLPPQVGRVVAPRDQRSLRGFAFAKWALTAEHERALDMLAREIVKSWFSRSSVIRIVLQGHTDPVGKPAFNCDLGRARARSVAKRLKQLVNDYAASVAFPAGVLDRIEYVVETYGEERPFSRSFQALNRRVEVTLHRDYRPPPNPLDEDSTLTRQTALLRSTAVLDPDKVKRLNCILQKVRQPGTDDRYLNDTQVFLTNRDNAMPVPTEWSRARNVLLDPRLFRPDLPDDRIVANLSQLDDDIALGIAKMNQIIAYAKGPDHALGMLALANAFKQFNAWIMPRFKDQASIYSCYADLFL